jgi:hypothetical protein
MLVEDLDGVVPGSPDTPKLPFLWSPDTPKAGDARSRTASPEAIRAGGAHSKTSPEAIGAGGVHSRTASPEAVRAGGKAGVVGDDASQNSRGPLAMKTTGDGTPSGSIGLVRASSSGFPEIIRRLSTSILSADAEAMQKAAEWPLRVTSHWGPAWTSEIYALHSMAWAANTFALRAEDVVNAPPSSAYLRAFDLPGEPFFMERLLAARLRSPFGSAHWRRLPLSYANVKRVVRELRFLILYGDAESMVEAASMVQQTWGWALDRKHATPLTRLGSCVSRSRPLGCHLALLPRPSPNCCR